jgi:hypothetical protein
MVYQWNSFGWLKCVETYSKVHIDKNLFDPFAVQNSVEMETDVFLLWRFDFALECATRYVKGSSEGLVVNRAH